MRMYTEGSSWPSVRVDHISRRWAGPDCGHGDRCPVTGRARRASFQTTGGDSRALRRKNYLLENLKQGLFGALFHVRDPHAHASAAAQPSPVNKLFVWVSTGANQRAVYNQFIRRWELIEYACYSSALAYMGFAQYQNDIGRDNIIRGILPRAVGLQHVGW